MKLARLFLFTVACLFAATLHLTGQTPAFPDVSTLTAETLINATIEPVFSLVVLLSGYVSAFIPGIKKWAPFNRVIAFALVTGLGFALFGGASFWKLALTYFLTSGLYVVVAKNIFASPKAAAA